MRNAFSETLYELACQDDRIVVVAADISPAGSMVKFREQHPDRFINVGVAESSAVGIAAGLALKGMRPWVYTIAPFALYRPYEFVRDDVAYQKLPVVIVGIGGGVTYSTLGSTHHAMDDIAVASNLPGFTVLAPCDGPETADCVRWLSSNDHTGAYLRLGKVGEPVLTKYANPFKFAQPRILRSITGATTAILTYGPIAAMAMEAASGKPVDVIAFPTLKPFDSELLFDVVTSYRHVVVVEEHVYRGGLGQQAQHQAERVVGGWRTPDVFHLQDRFIHCYGSHRDILAAHGITVDAITEAIS